MENETLKLNERLMQEISLNRSKVWSKYFAKFEKEEGCEMVALEIDKLEEYDYNNEAAQIDSHSDSDMAEEVDPIESGESNVTSSKDMMMISRNITKCSNARGILAQLNKGMNESGIFDSELLKVLEETLPIVEAYWRNSRDTGFDDVLRTFDLEKIEKVESSMRQNNSITSQSFSSPDDYRGREFYRKKKMFSRNKQRNDFYDSDSESLHSVDTGRYIRSSRVHKHISTKTTTIKSYRLVESKRNELRSKYACLMVDDTLQLLKKGRCRQPTFKYQSARKNASDIHRIDRNIRRVPRRFNKSPNTSYSSSEEEESFERDKNLKTLSCKHESHCSSRTSKCLPQSLYANDYDVRRLPYMNETECTCNGADRLCKNVRHFANSSAEEWIIENCESPLETAPQHLKEVEAAEPKCKGNIPDKLSASQKNITIGSEHKTKKSTTKEKRATNNKKNEMCNEQPHEDSDGSFESQLQMALKLSKQEYEKNLMRKKNIKKTDNKRGKNYDNENVELSHTGSKLSTQLAPEWKIDDSLDKHESVKSTFKLEHERKITNNTKSKDAKTSSKTQNDDIKSNINSNKRPKIMKPSVVIDKKVHKKTSALKRIAEESDASPHSTQRINSNNQEPSSHLKKPVKLTLNSTDYTALFANSGNLCNSTALANNTATYRQFPLTKTSIQKSNSNVSKNRLENSKANEHKLKLPDLKVFEPSIPLNDPVQANHIRLSDSDCEIISSTTDNDLQITKIPPPKLSKKEDNYVLLYTPKNRSLAPSHSLSDGKFQLTEEHLASIIGKTKASKFMKYYIGSKYFNESSTVYYIPPNPDDESYSSGSEIDILNLCSHYGNVIEVKNFITQM